MSFYLTSAQLIMLVAGSDVWLLDDELPSPSHSYYALHSFLHDFEDEHNVKEETAHDVLAGLQALVSDVLGAVLNILDASEAAVVVMIATVGRSSISAEGKGVSV